ncbi:hypothetical protein ADL29_00665 [Streptomyces chattanoogensis]|uniref:Uncharacterized protein n=1 Tax=Streptomyces chattanoogensis TaxID=66876 RepID=A0A0N0H420_9ACTN|nr:hypothetical protein ADL29_00665 [Streptomyces chattanoogensis]
MQPTTTLAVAGITFAGVAPATAATAKTAAASSRNCDAYLLRWKQHENEADKYRTLYRAEARKAHPDPAKLRQYEELVKQEVRTADVHHAEYNKCRKG